jgi:hypothetical protein
MKKFGEESKKELVFILAILKVIEHIRFIALFNRVNLTKQTRVLI